MAEPQSLPEPRGTGSIERGAALLAGGLPVAGAAPRAAGGPPWGAPVTDAAAVEALHGFGWLEDLAAVGSRPAVALARSWTADWLRRYGRGGGPGWTPPLAGRRLRQWLARHRMLTAGDPALAEALGRAYVRHAAFLARRAGAAEGALGAIEAWAGLLAAALAAGALSRHAGPAEAGLAAAAAAVIDPGGAIASRNPEELAEIFALITASAAALAEAGRIPAPALLAALERTAPVLRALRHADGGLARFHGGGRGAEGLLDRALAATGLRSPALRPLAMGYARLAAGRTTVILDAAAPPRGAASAEAHASTLAFELTSGRRPLIVSCGPGRPFGPDWQTAARETASHSTLALEAGSSSRFGPDGRILAPARVRLIELPDRAPAEAGAGGPPGLRLVAAQEGWLASHGLVHSRRLELSADGRMLTGEDVLAAEGRAAMRRLARAVERAGGGGLPFAIRFHLHPQVAAELDPGGHAVWLRLMSGEIWAFRHEGLARLTLEPSVWLEPGARGPVATKQIVLAAVLIDYSGRVGWSLAKTPDTPLAARDLAAAAPVPVTGEA